MMKMNEARKSNNKAVVEETERLHDPNYERRRTKQDFWTDKRAREQTLVSQGVSKDKAYLYDPASKAEKSNLKRKNPSGTFGWDVFNDDTLYKAYFKRVKGMHPTGLPEDPEARKDLLTQDLDKQKQKQEEFQRRRMFADGEKDIDYINDRNRVFNEKLERNFGGFAKDIKAKLESGNAV